MTPPQKIETPPKRGAAELEESEATVSTDDEGADTDPESISKDTLFVILKNRRRRDILKYLRENDDESTLSDLAEFIAAKENGVERRLLSSDERKRVYIGLYQCHLPKMDDARVVDFEKRSGDVRLREEADQLFEYIDDGDEEEAADEDDAAGTSLVGQPAKAALGWAFCLLALLSVMGAPLLGPVGILGGLAAGTFAAVETIDLVSASASSD